MPNTALRALDELSHIISNKKYAEIDNIIILKIKKVDELITQRIGEGILQLGWRPHMFDHKVQTLWSITLLLRSVYWVLRLKFHSSFYMYHYM